MTGIVHNRHRCTKVFLEVGHVLGCQESEALTDSSGISKLEGKLDISLHAAIAHDDQGSH